MATDKYKTCKDCSDREVGCHGTCEGYQFRCQEREEIRKKERARRMAPTEHHRKIVIDFYKRKKKYRNL